MDNLRSFVVSQIEVLKKSGIKTSKLLKLLDLNPLTYSRLSDQKQAKNIFKHIEMFLKLIASLKEDEAVNKFKEFYKFYNSYLSSHTQHKTTNNEESEKKLTASKIEEDEDLDDNEVDINIDKDEDEDNLDEEYEDEEFEDEDYDECEDEEYDEEWNVEKV